MMQEGLKQIAEIPLMLMAMFLFFGAYIGVLTFALWGKRSKEKMDHFAGLPFTEDDRT